MAFTVSPLGFTCTCGARLETPEVLEGRRVRCPACRAIVVASGPAPAAVLVDPAPPDPDRAVPFVPGAAPADEPFRHSFFGRVYGDFMLPVGATWIALLAWWGWTGDDMGELPARVLFIAATFAVFFAGFRIPKHLDAGLTESLL